MRRCLPLLLSLLGCAPDDIVVATLVDERDPGVPSGCQTQADCGVGAYCSKSACADSAGSCTVRPTICEREPAPVCGCDGVTYFNDCVRAQRGVSAAYAGDCRNPETQRCGGADDVPCPAGSYCAKLLPNDAVCDAAVVGTCWVLSACDSSPRGGERFVPCDDDAEGDPDDCVDACTAISSELPHKRVFRCRGERERDDIPRR
jgi:hypothetical protein